VTLSDLQGSEHVPIETIIRALMTFNPFALRIEQEMELSWDMVYWMSLNCTRLLELRFRSVKCESMEELVRIFQPTLKTLRWHDVSLSLRSFERFFSSVQTLSIGDVRWIEEEEEDEEEAPLHQGDRICERMEMTEMDISELFCDTFVRLGGESHLLKHVSFENCTWTPEVFQTLLLGILLCPTIQIVEIFEDHVLTDADVEVFLGLRHPSLCYLSMNEIEHTSPHLVEAIYLHVRTFARVRDVIVHMLCWKTLPRFQSYTFDIPKDLIQMLFEYLMLDDEEDDDDDEE